MGKVEGVKDFTKGDRSSQGSDWDLQRFRAKPEIHARVLQQNPTSATCVHAAPAFRGRILVDRDAGKSTDTTDPFKYQ